MQEQGYAGKYEQNLIPRLRDTITAYVGWSLKMESYGTNGIKEHNKYVINNTNSCEFKQCFLGKKGDLRLRLAAGGIDIIEAPELQTAADDRLGGWIDRPRRGLAVEIRYFVEFHVWFICH